MSFSGEQLYVLVVERDCNVGDPHTPRPIVFEQHIDNGSASLSSVKEFQSRLAGRYGKTRIARLDFIEDWKGEQQ